MFILLLIVFLVILYYYGTRNYNYWEKKGVKHIKPVIPFIGNNARLYLMQKSVRQITDEMYWNYPNEKFVGFFRGNNPELIIRDPELIKRILITDFNYFYPRGLNKHKIVEPMLKNLFFADGDTWRLLRQRMTPAFTSGKLKYMFPLIVERAERLQTRVKEAAEIGKEINVRELMARYTTDFIGACGFGIDTDSLSDENSTFRKLGSNIFNITPKMAIMMTLKEIFPEIFKHYRVMSHVESDLVSLVRKILKQRYYKPSGRNDFIDLLLELKQKGLITGESIEKVNSDGTPVKIELELDDILMAAQVFVFFAAGFETSSSATSYTLHQLAFYPEEQVKIQKEIDRVLAKYDNKLCYEAVNEMTYLEMAFYEGMRMFPSLGFLIRHCVKNYTIPGTDITIDDKVGILIPVQAIHNDEQYFDNPSEFRPERFLPEEVQKRHKSVYLPFGSGPRACIGERLGKMQSIAGLAAILSKYSVEPSSSTIRNVVADPTPGIVQTVSRGLPLKLKKREDISF